MWRFLDGGGGCLWLFFFSLLCRSFLLPPGICHGDDPCRYSCRPRVVCLMSLSLCVVPSSNDRRAAESDCKGKNLGHVPCCLLRFMTMDRIRPHISMTPAALRNDTDLFSYRLDNFPSSCSLHITLVSGPCGPASADTRGPDTVSLVLGFMRRKSWCQQSHRLRLDPGSGVPRLVKTGPAAR